MFLRDNQVNILKYLPEFLQSDINFKNVANVCSNEHEKIRLIIQDIFNQFFVETATWGLSSYERVLEITPKATEDYTARRNRILARYQANQTSTKAFMTELVRRYTSSGTGEIEELNSQNAFDIVVGIDDVKDWAGITETLDLYKPAHLAMYLAICIYQEWKIKHSFYNYITFDSISNNWNTGTATPIVWDSMYRLDGTINLSGYSASSDFRLRQHHDIEILINDDDLERDNLDNKMTQFMNNYDGSWILNGVRTMTDKNIIKQTNDVWHNLIIEINGGASNNE